MSLTWVPHPATESLLRSLGIDFELTEIPFADIDLKKSAMNRARLVNEPLIPDAIYQYKMAMEEESAAFPAVTSYRNCTSTLLADGNQRCNAFKDTKYNRKGATIGTYLMKTDDQYLIDLATRYLNRGNGVGQSSDEAVQHAIELLNKYPSLTNTDVAKIAGVSRQAIQRAVKIREAADQLVRAGVRAKNISKGALHKLSQIHNQPAMIAAGKIAANHNITADQAQDIAREIKGKRSEAEQLKVCAEWESKLIKGERGTGRINTYANRDKLHRIFSQLLSHANNNPSREAMQLTSQGDFDAAEAKWDEIKKALAKVLK